MTTLTTVPAGGGLSDFEASLASTLCQVCGSEISDLLIAGFTEHDLLIIVATTPPFSSALTEVIRRHLRAATVA